MPRLIDDLRAKTARLAMPHFVTPSKEGAWQKIAKQLHEQIMDPDLPVIVIDNVSEYYYTSEQEYWDLRDDFPNLAPPYPAAWFESKMQKRIHSKEKGDTDVAAFCPNGRIGLLMHALDPAQCAFEGPWDERQSARWILWCELFIDFGRRGVTCDGPHGSMFVAVDKDGVILDRPWMQSFIESDADPLLLEVMRSHMTWLHPAFLAISFLHCKNVTLVDNVVPKPLAKKYREKHGVAPTGYKTLVIEPLKQILRHEGGSDKVGIQKAMHICRGHFKDYREGRGLFGKYKMLVWQPSIVRGTRGEKAPPREVEVKLVP